MTGTTLEARPGADPDDGKETETLTGEATRRIRQSILDGELEPNARLNEVHLCDSVCTEHLNSGAVVMKPTQEDV